LVLLASLEVEIRGLQRALTTANLGTEEGRAEALKIQGKVQGLMRAQDLMVEIGNGDVKDEELVLDPAGFMGTASP